MTIDTAHILLPCSAHNHNHPCINSKPLLLYHCLKRVMFLLSAQCKCMCNTRLSPLPANTMPYASPAVIVAVQWSLLVKLQPMPPQSSVQQSAASVQLLNSYYVRKGSIALEETQQLWYQPLVTVTSTQLARAPHNRVTATVSGLFCSRMQLPHCLTGCIMWSRS